MRRILNGGFGAAGVTTLGGSGFTGSSIGAEAIGSALAEEEATAGWCDGATGGVEQAKGTNNASDETMATEARATRVDD